MNLDFIQCGEEKGQEIIEKITGKPRTLVIYILIEWPVLGGNYNFLSLLLRLRKTEAAKSLITKWTEMISVIQLK